MFCKTRYQKVLNSTWKKGTHCILFGAVEQKQSLFKSVAYMILIFLLIAVLFSGVSAAATKNVGPLSGLQTALTGSSVDGNTVTLGQDVILKHELKIDRNVIVDLNGYTITATDNRELFTISDRNSLTLRDSMGGGKLVGDRCVYVSEGGKFIMDGGSIVGCSVGKYGGVYVSDGTFTMNGGSITGCSAGEYSGGVYVFGGKFIMNGGSITGCSASKCGGGVSVSGGEFIMKDGSITSCSAGERGGGVYVTGTFITHDDYSAGIFTMLGGNITDCSAGEGGGVYVDVGGRFEMDSSSLTNCCADNGGGVYVANAVFSISGSSNINDCNVDECGGGVYVNGGILNVKDSVKITGNTKADGSTNNVYLYNSISKPSSLRLTDEFTGSIGISNPLGDVQFGSVTAGASGGSNFFDDTDATITGYAIGSVLLWPISEVSTWEELATAVSKHTDTDTAKTVVVTQDITDRKSGDNENGIDVIGKVIIIPKVGVDEIKINGNGVGRIFNIAKTGNLILAEKDGTVLTLTGGKMINGNGGCVYVSGGVFEMDGCKITNCCAYNGGGVYVSEGRFTINSGSISDCDASINGGGVYVFGGKFAMNGGNIGGCNAGTSGGGIHVFDGRFNVGGCAEITGNTGEMNQNNVYLNGNDILMLDSDYTGTMGIVYAGADPETNLKFGDFGSGSGAEKFFADGVNLVGSISGSDLVWDVPSAHDGSSESTVMSQSAQASNSPVPYIGILAGICVVAVFFGLRKK